MSGATYVAGVVAVVAIVVPLCLAARALRRTFLDDWTGAPAVLAGSVIGLGLLVGIAQVLGTFGILDSLPLVLAVAGCSTVIVVVERRRRGSSPQLPAGERRPKRGLQIRPAVIVATVVVLAIALPWAARTIGSFRSGISGFDSLDYHLPFAGRFFQTGRTTSLYYTFPALATAFHPADAELVQAIGMLATHRDVLAPVLNLGWLALALLAAWSAFAPRRTRVLAMAGVGMLLATPLFVEFSGGRATNDLATVALFVSSVALLLNSRGRPAAVGIAAVAAGLALATKLTMVVPVIALTIGVIAVAAAGTRRKTAIVWLPWVLVTGCYWYVRNLAAVGNPVPALQVGLGPLSLPTPTTQGPYTSYSVAHYLTDLDVWQHWFIPGLRDAFGLAWPLILGLAAAGWIVAIVRGDRMQQMLGVVGVVTLIGYLFTPAGAGGVSGRPVLFASDSRFAFAALALGLLLLPGVVPARSVVHRRWLPALLAIGLASDVIYTLKDEFGLSAAAIVVEVVLVVVLVGVLVARSSGSRATFAIVGCCLLLFGAAAGWVIERSYLDKRYANVANHVPYGSAPRTELVGLYGWVRGVSNARIGLNGLGISYPFFGADLSNTVDYVAHEGPNGNFDEATTCREWRQLLDDGKYDYVVISPNASNAPEPPSADWTRSDPAAQLILQAGKASVYRVHGTFNPDTCPT